MGDESVTIVSRRAQPNPKSEGISIYPGLVVILLQEAWTAKARESAPGDGQWCIARAACQHTFFQQSGLMTLSRFPVISGQFYPFSHAAFPDRFVNKGVLKTTVRLANGQALNIWNVHLQDGGSAAVRLSQVRELEAWVRAAEDEQVADIVAGDFNCTPESPLYRELSDSFGPSAQELSGKAPFVTFDGLSDKNGPRETLDHIFIRRSSPFQSVRVSPRTSIARDKISPLVIDVPLDLCGGRCSSPKETFGELQQASVAITLTHSE